MPNQSQEEFLKDLVPPQENDPFAQVPEPVAAELSPEPAKEDEDDKANRRERRLQAKLQAERESSIALAARLEALTEAQKFSRESSPSSFEEKASRIYGTATPENAAATELLIASIKEASQAAKQEALSELREEQRKTAEATKKEEQNLDRMVEEIEDENGVTLDQPTQTGFFQLLEKLSPKDTQGNVIAYADHHAVWDEYQARKQRAQPPNNRAKDLASRSMVNSGSSPAANLDANVNEKWLLENGLI